MASCVVQACWCPDIVVVRHVMRACPTPCHVSHSTAVPTSLFHDPAGCAHLSSLPCNISAVMLGFVTCVVLGICIPDISLWSAHTSRVTQPNLPCVNLNFLSHCGRKTMELSNFVFPSSQRTFIYCFYFIPWFQDVILDLDVQAFFHACSLPVTIPEIRRYVSQQGIWHSSVFFPLLGKKRDKY